MPGARLLNLLTKGFFAADLHLVPQSTLLSHSASYFDHGWMPKRVLSEPKISIRLTSKSAKWILAANVFANRRDPERKFFAAHRSLPGDVPRRSTLLPVWLSPSGFGEL